eukprot:TRINITY_DN20069_c0_g1_i1.p1 TRINITY_DN20069_c0_g1~~TRINITY_DN20069_c0_g1_i1.p1  ORF type:complete len:182 (+),score=16.52 TRINITY_DN20069_c0_g1_i1:67-612(+)
MAFVSRYSIMICFATMHSSAVRKEADEIGVDSNSSLRVNATMISSADCSKMQSDKTIHSQVSSASWRYATSLYDPGCDTFFCQYYVCSECNVCAFVTKPLPEGQVFWCQLLKDTVKRTPSGGREFTCEAMYLSVWDRRLPDAMIETIAEDALTISDHYSSNSTMKLAALELSRSALRRLER